MAVSAEQKDTVASNVAATFRIPSIALDTRQFSSTMSTYRDIRMDRLESSSSLKGLKWILRRA